MQVSVIVPFHKGVHFLTDCLESLREQTYQKFETIVVKDHVQEEEAQKLLSSYKSKLNLKIYDLEGETGVSAARNLGIKKAQGEYIYFLDSDDYISSSTLEDLLEMAEQKRYDIVYGILRQTWFRRSVYYGAEQYGQEEDQRFCGDAKKDLLVHRLNEAYLTCVHMLIKKELFENKNSLFCEDLKYYGDIPVLAYFLNFTGNIGYCETAEYIKRRHNDEIQFPSLSQASLEDRPQKLVRAYQEIGKIATELRAGFDQKLIDFCSGAFLRNIRNDKAEEWNKSTFFSVHQYVKHIEMKSINDEGNNEKKVLRALKSDSYAVCKKRVNKILAGRKIHRMLREKRFLYRTINKYLFERLSRKNRWIVFETFFGKQYSDSPKYIYEYLLKHYGDQYQYIWIINDRKAEIPGSPKRAERFSLKYFYYTARAKYWISNVRQPVWFDKKEDQLFLETWHGTPLKRLGFDMEENYSASPEYKKQIYAQSRNWDYLLSDNPFSTEKFQSCFLYEKDKILEIGYPRNDILYADHKDRIAEQLRKKLEIPENKKAILYAPTWRDDEYYDQGKYKFHLALDLKRLQKEIGDQYVILLRTHYFIADMIDVSGMEDFVFNVSQYPDIAELYLISDICITDYSSVFFDFANLKRPILFFTYDLEKYRDILHGFYLDIQKDVPGPLLRTNDEVIDAIKNIEEIEQQYKDKYKEFYDKFCCFDDGHAAERLVNMIFKS